MSFRDSIIALSKEFTEEAEAASSLWSYLPSHDDAKTLYGDYAGDNEPSLHHILLEATFLLQRLSGYNLDDSELSWMVSPHDDDADKRIPTEAEVDAWITKQLYSRWIKEQDTVTLLKNVGNPEKDR